MELAVVFFIGFVAGGCAGFAVAALVLGDDKPAEHKRPSLK